MEQRRQGRRFAEAGEKYEDIVNELCGRACDFSIYLMLQVLNKVVSEHPFPFPKFVLEHQLIRAVVDLCELDSKLVQVEVVKFYKALLKTKDRCY